MTRKRRELDHNASLLFEDRTAPPQAGWGDLARFVAAARESLPVEPTDRTRAEHLKAISSAVVEDRTRVAAGSLETIPRRRTLMDRTKPALARLALAIATLTGSTAGLAYAGVDLPGQAAEKAFSAVGVDLPNQGDDELETTETDTTETETEEVTVTSEHESAVATLVKDVIANRDTYETGCEFGQAVAAAASSNSQGDGGSDQDPCTKDDQGGDGGPSETGATKSAEGKAKAEENKTNAGSDAQGSQETGTTKSSEGKAKAEENKNNAGGDAQGGSETGLEKSADGRSTAEEHVGGPSED